MNTDRKHPASLCEGLQSHISGALGLVLPVVLGLLLQARWLLAACDLQSAAWIF